MHDALQSRQALVGQRFAATGLADYSSGLILSSLDKWANLLVPHSPPPDRPLRVMLCHAYYQQRGGEDESFEAERQLLETNGHDVATSTFDNSASEGWSAFRQATSGFWNRKAYKEMRQRLLDHSSQLLH